MSLRRAPYDRIAQQYERARPTYPEALFDDIVAYANLGARSRLLEIGCGTGQATLPLAERGFAIDCVELGEKLAAVARDKLAPFPKAKVIVADFETAELRSCYYDLVFAATAFHWIDPAVGFVKARRLLKPGGALALFWHRPVLTDISRAYIEAAQEIYQRVAPELALDYELPPHPDHVTTEYAEGIPASGLFHELTIRKHYVVNNYSAETYVDLLGTHSDHIKLPIETRRRLFKEIGALIETDFEGVCLRETVALLYLARRL